MSAYVKRLIIKTHSISELVRCLITTLIFIGPKSDHWLCFSLTHSHLVNLIDVTLACEDADSKLVDVSSVADVDDEDRVGNSLLQF